MTFEYFSIFAAARMRLGLVVASVGRNSLMAGSYKQSRLLIAVMTSNDWRELPVLNRHSPSKSPVSATMVVTAFNCSKTDMLAFFCLCSTLIAEWPDWINWVSLQNKFLVRLGETIVLVTFQRRPLLECRGEIYAWSNSVSVFLVLSMKQLCWVTNIIDFRKIVSHARP